MTGYLYMLVTVVMTTYGNLIFKWRVDEAGAMPEGASARITYFLKLLSSPWILSSFAAACCAAIAYLLALQRLDLSRAYPVMSLSFVLVLLFSAALFSESITTAKVAGIVLILAGLWIGSQAWG
jgi:multidrug transporter EmrE-like cation transporter